MPDMIVHVSTDWYISVGSTGQGNEQTILCCGRELQVCEVIPAEPR